MNHSNSKVEKQNSRKSKLPLILKGFFVLCIALMSSGLVAQSLNSSWVYIQNVHTGKLMDVKGDIKEAGTTVWPFKLNHGKAQIFRMISIGVPDKYGEDARFIQAYRKEIQRLDLFISVKTPPMVVTGSGTANNSSSGSFSTELLNTNEVLVGNNSVNTKKTLDNYRFTIEEKQEFESPTSAFGNNTSLSVGTKPKQIWKIIPVPNEPNVYYIQNAQFKDKMVIESKDTSSGGTLILSSFTGENIQKWRIKKTAPKMESNFKLSDFEFDRNLIQDPWYKPWKWHAVYDIQGKLSWDNNNSKQVSQKVIISLGSEREKITVDPNKNSLDFKVKSTVEAKNKEHCFLLLSSSKWIVENYVIGEQICQVPKDKDEVSSRPSQGVGKLLISNCHNDKESVRIWTLDLTANNGVWKDHGRLESQWQNSGCPGTKEPKEIKIEDDHVYILVVIDCGDLPPSETNVTCHKLTSGQIQGKKDGSSLSFQIN